MEWYKLPVWIYILATGVVLVGAIYFELSLQKTQQLTPKPNESDYKVYHCDLNPNQFICKIF